MRTTIAWAGVVLPWLLWAALAAVAPRPAAAQVLDKQRLLQAQSFWDNRDWDWYQANIPIFESPDAELNTTYYYRWELLTKHLTYGSPNSGYSFTEFIDRPFWSGTYGAISCPAGLQLYEARWLRDARYLRDYGRYWLRTPGAQPRRYSTWLADAIWAGHLAHPDPDYLRDLLPDLIKNHQGWERSNWVAEQGMFWQVGHDDGMEININSRQTQDENRGAPGFRPTLNSYLWADALAIARIADLAGDAATAARLRRQAAQVKEQLQTRLWDPRRQFFFHMAQRDEQRNGHVVKALSLTHQTGQFAGSPHGRELIGYVPWQFNLPDPGYESAWKFLLDPDYFFAPFGPTTVERHDPLFLISKHCCVWSGQSWPYGTSQTLKAMANLLQNYRQDVVTVDDYVKLLGVFARTHRKEGRPYIAEAAQPDTGSWEGHDAYNHSEHYFHSNFADLVITGLVGLVPRDDETLEVRPLAPAAWDYFALDEVRYRGRDVSVLWDRTGKRYGLGPGLHLLVGGKSIAHAPKLGPLTAKLPPAERAAPAPTTVNYAVNNDGDYFPRLSASYAAPGTSAGKLIDGNYWYHAAPPNRWTSAGSKAPRQTLTLDFGLPRPIDTVKLYFLEDQPDLLPPSQFELRAWDGQRWVELADQQRQPAEPTGRRANVVRFAKLETSRLEIALLPRAGAAVGLSELEAWGPATLSVGPAPPPRDNLAFNPGDRPFPKASASHTSRFDRVAMANDGVVSFSVEPHNRWTSFESPRETDWLEIDFGQPRAVGRAELAIFDDGKDVRPPARYQVQWWDGKAWQDVSEAVYSPREPSGGTFNEARFRRVSTPKLRVVFTHRGPARCGVSEVFLWPE